MGVTYALLAMMFFASNIIVTRYAVMRLPVEAGFFVVLATNILFPALLFPFELAARASPWSWDWKGAGMFALGGVIGTFLGRRMLFDAVRLLGPSRASVFHSTAPAFALAGAWLLADERLGLYEIGLMALACQVLATRDWGKIAGLLRGADRRALWLYVGCGVTTALGSIFVALAMNRIEIALAVLVKKRIKQETKS